MEYLGLIIGKNGVHPLPERVIFAKGLQTRVSISPVGVV